MTSSINHDLVAIQNKRTLGIIRRSSKPFEI